MVNKIIKMVYKRESFCNPGLWKPAVVLTYGQK